MIQVITIMAMEICYAFPGQETCEPFIEKCLYDNSSQYEIATVECERSYVKTLRDP